MIAGSPSIGRFALYFLRLGALGFGGPIALANTMRKDLVEERAWLTEEEYEDGLAIAAACPGPLAYQLEVYCGFVKHGVAGGLAVAVAFAAAPFLLVTLAAWAYTRFSATSALRGIFYGVAPVVVALILKACFSLGRKTLRADRLAWLVALLACGITVLAQRELVVIFLASGVLGIAAFAPKTPLAGTPPSAPGGTPPVAPGAAIAVVPLAATGISSKLFLFFFKTGLLVFGSGLVIVPFLKTYVVDEYHWLGTRAFLDAVAIGMISPGPVVITATFVGFLLGGLAGAAAATAGIFSPAVLFTLVATPLVRRFRHQPRLMGFVRGITVAVVGVLVGTTTLVAKTAIGDAPTLSIAALTLAVLVLWPKVPEPALVLLGALVGLVAYPLLMPEWVLS